MAADRQENPGRRERRRQRKRLQQQRTGDTPEKKRERARKSNYSAEDMAEQTAIGAFIGNYLPRL